MKPIPIERRGEFLVKMYELEEDVCRDLLLRCKFGRIAFRDADEGLTVLPVNCLYSNDALVFRTSAGSALDRMCDGPDVAFEADDIDAVSESGWSVLVRGRASRLGDPDWIAGLADTEVRPWAPAHRDVWIKIEPARITGRIIRRERHPSDDGQLPYLTPG